MPSVLYGRPTQFPWLETSIADDAYIDDLGGMCIRILAAENLNYGDLVFFTLGGEVDKHLNASWYHSRFAGVVVGGDLTNGEAVADPARIGVQMVSAGKRAVVQTSGVAYVAADAAAGFSYYGQPIISGQTTAGRALGMKGNTGSYATTDSGFQIHGAASTVGKITNATQVIISGALGTAIAAADTAALSGTVNNATFNVFEARSTGSTNQSTAMGTAATTLAGVVLPAAPSVGIATYGVIIVNPTGTGNFVGGTTALDDGTVIPNSVFVELLGIYPFLGWAIDTGITAGTALRMRII